MSLRTRRGIRHPTAENAIQKAHDLVASTDTASVKKIWEGLCQSHLAALGSGLTLEAFPNWILRNIPHEVIPRMLEAVYGKGAKTIEFYAPSLCKRFDKPQWQFVLFLGSLSQPKVTALNALAKKRTDITFDSLYRELCQIRSKKQPLPDGPVNFKLAEFRSCFKTNNSGDEYESNSDVDHEDSDETSHGTIYVSSNEDDYDRDSEVSDEYDFEDILDSPANYNASPEPEVPEAGKLPDSEPTADSITVATNHTMVDMQGQNTCADETLGQHIVDLCNTTNSLCNTANLLRKQHEELEQEQVDTRSRSAKTSEDINAAVKSIQLILNAKDNFTPEKIEIGQANWSGLRDLVKKHKIEQTECQGQQAKWSKLKADVNEFNKKVKATR